MPGRPDTLRVVHSRISDGTGPERSTSSERPSDSRDLWLQTQALYEHQPGWVTFYREVFGHQGLISRTFPTPEEQDEFRLSDMYFRMHEMLAELRNRAKDNVGREEPLRVITIRIPRSLHESLREEAYAYRTSMNKLCISKLVQRVPVSLVPRDV